MANATTADGKAKEGGGKFRNTMLYVRQHWQLYVLFIMPAFLMTIIFRYIPMGGVLIAFEEYNPFRGILGSQWVGLAHFQRFLKSPDFYALSDQHAQVECIRVALGLPRADSSGLPA